MLKGLTKEEVNSMFDAIEIIKKECKEVNALAYANAFALAGVLYGQEGVKTQLLCILNNTQYWRGENAKNVKKTLRAIVKKL